MLVITHKTPWLAFIFVSRGFEGKDKILLDSLLFVYFFFPRENFPPRPLILPIRSNEEETPCLPHMGNSSLHHLHHIHPFPCRTNPIQLKTTLNPPMDPSKQSTIHFNYSSSLSVLHSCIYI